MKKTFFALVFTVFLSVFATGSIFALSDISPPKRLDERLQQVQERREGIKEKIATKTAQLRDEHVTRLKQVFNRILNRYEAALNRLAKIVEKLEKRMDKLAARGVNTANAVQVLSNCQAKKTEAEAAIADARTKIESIDSSSSTVRETLKTSVDAIRSAKRSIRDYHKCLVEVTRMLKASIPKEGTESAE